MVAVQEEKASMVHTSLNKTEEISPTNKTPRKHTHRQTIADSSLDNLPASRVGRSLPTDRLKPDPSR